MAHLDPLPVRLCLGGLPRTVQELLRHLLLCPECREALAPWYFPETSAGEEDAPPDEGDEYSEIFARLDPPSLVRQYAEQRQLCAPLLPLLLAQPSRAWPELLERHPAARSAAFVDLLLEEPAPGVVRDAQENLRRALLAFQVLRRLPPAVSMEGPALHLHCRAYTLLAETLRDSNDWHQAQAAYEGASRLLSRDLGCSEEAAFALSLARALHHEGRLPDALALANRAAEVYSQLGERILEGAACELIATIYTETGDLQHVLAPLARALLAAEASPGHEAHAARLRQRLSWALATDGQYRAAHEILADAGIEAPPDLLRILVLLTDVPHLEAHFAATLRRVHEPGRAFEAAVSGLNLAGIYLRGGRLDELPRLYTPLLIAAGSAELAPEAREQLGQICLAITEGSLSIRHLLAAAACLTCHPLPDDDITHPEQLTH